MQQVIKATASGREEMRPAWQRVSVRALPMLVTAFATVLALFGNVQAQVIPGDVLVADGNGGATLQGALFRVDPTSGQRTILSDFGNAAQGPTGNSPEGVVFEST
jgi:hypothetical protein